MLNIQGSSLADNLPLHIDGDSSCLNVPSVDSADYRHHLVSWWHGCRPFFQEHAPQVVSQIDDDANRLLKLTATDPSFCVCVLGQSAVGKSTLLNAIVAGENTILPAGGIGPLTALATEVRYSTEPYIDVTYRTSKRLSGFRLQLEKELKKQNRDSQLCAAQENDVDEVVEIASADSTASRHDDAGTKQADNTSFLDLCRQVTQILTGNQYTDLPLSQVVIGLRAILGLKVDSLDVFSEQDKNRITVAARILAENAVEVPVRYSKSDLNGHFDALLNDHVSGHLCPLVERIEVGYPFLSLDKDVVLVDLPGVGIANDRYRSVTSEYVRQKASAVVLVVDRAGLTDASVELIRDSGYWDRLLLSSTDPEKDQCELLLVVTKVDDVARTQYTQQNHIPREQRLTKAELFKQLQDDMRTALRSQADSCFRSLTAGVSDDEDVVAARLDAQATMMNKLGVFPVSAIEYRNFLADDEDQPFIHDVDASGVPALANHLEDLAKNYKERLTLNIDDVSRRLTRTIFATLQQILSSWHSTSRVAEEAEALRKSLERFLEPKRKELENRKGAFREFLNYAGTSRIAELVAKAQLTAQQEVASYLTALRNVHWATLRATVVRGGAFVNTRGLRVDLAADVAQRFQEPMASIWGRTLLKEVQQRTIQHGVMLEGLVADICEWTDQYADTAERQTLRAQQSLMRDRVEQLGSVGSEAIDELKDAIKRDLMATIEGPIRSQCQAFQRRGDAMGAGVKQRIVALFDALALEAVAAAAKPTTRLLEMQFMRARHDITMALEQWGDPIDQASNAIIESDEHRRRRHDAERRRLITQQIEQLLAAKPTTQHIGAT